MIETPHWLAWRDAHGEWDREPCACPVDRDHRRDGSPVVPVPYADIPQTMRDALDMTYHPEGVEIWWNAANTGPGRRSPADLWPTVEGRARVRDAVERLDGVKPEPDPPSPAAVEVAPDDPNQPEESHG